MVSRWLISQLSNIDPEARRLWAARIFVACIVGHIVSHVVLVMQSAGFFEHVLMFISWGAVELTCVDIVQTSDVKVDVAEGTTA